MKFLLLVVAFATLMAGSAFADCATPTGSTGTLMWNTTYSVVQVCNGTNWVALGGNGNDGSGETDPQVGSLTDGKWCTASGGVVTCNSDTPLASVALDDLTDATITTPASGNVLNYNGSAWVNTPITSLISTSTALGDRITSGTTAVTVQSGGVISITTNGATANYFNTSGQLITAGIGVGVATPSASIHVSGTIMAKTAAADRVCTADENGALRYNSTTGRLQICR